MKKILLICCLFIGIAAAGYAQAGHPTVSDPEKKAKALQLQLKLTADQTQKVTVIYQESAHKYEKIKVEEHGNTNKMLTAIVPLRTATIKKIKAVLTADQAVKYDALVKQTKNSSLNSGWSDGWSSTALAN
jgi:protein CpxP